MRVITSVGEIGVSVGDRDVLFRPSLYAMGKLPDAVAAFHAIHTPISTKLGEFDRFMSAVEVLQACTDQDIDWLIGHTGRTYRTWVAGKMPARNCIILAASLIRHGVTGVVPIEENAPPPKRSDYAQKFEPRDIVAMAVAHLNMSSAEAWEMTVTSFILAMRAKYPTPKSDAPTQKEAGSKMEWLKRINQAR